MSLDWENLCILSKIGQIAFVVKVLSTAAQVRPVKSSEYAIAWLLMKMILNRIESKQFLEFLLKLNKSGINKFI